jgi:peptide deformylase
MLKIVTDPCPTLRERSTEVTDLSILQKTDFKDWLEKFRLTMHEKDGVGLAAPQVGKNIRIIAINQSATRLKMEEKYQPIWPKDLILINPIWQKTSRKQVTDLEGCLSVPNLYGKVKRYHDISVVATNEKGEEFKFEAHGFFARVVQHEVDHLDGILFIDKAKDLFTEKEEK